MVHHTSKHFGFLFNQIHEKRRVYLNVGMAVLALLLTCEATGFQLAVMVLTPAYNDHAMPTDSDI
jgi:hypothetical protein